MGINKYKQAVIKASALFEKAKQAEQDYVNSILAKSAPKKHSAIADTLFVDTSKYYRPEKGVTIAHSSSLELFDEANYIHPVYSY